MQEQNILEQNILEQNTSDNDRINIIKAINDKIFNSQLKDTEIYNNIIFVYTPPKVGSTALVSSIRLSASHKFTVIHIHDEIMLKYITHHKEDITINDIIKYNKSLQKNIYVIDIYRTPIERKISEYFEKISCYHFNNIEENINRYNIDLIITRFNNLFPHLGKGDHFYEVYGIQNEQFDFNKQYIHHIKDDINYIKLRLNDSKQWDKILTKILNTEIYIVPDYETNDKIIGNLYSKFKTTYKLPSNFFEDIKNDKFFILYMDYEERNKYLSNWCNKLTDNFKPYTQEQYDFYINLSMENQFYNDFQINHYIDNGCLCKLCSKKRNELFYKIKNGDIIKEKIIHNNVVEEVKKDKIQKITALANNISDKINKIKNKNVNKLSDNIISFKNNSNDRYKRNLGNIKF